MLANAAQPSRPLMVGDSIVVGDGYQSVWFLYKGAKWDIGRFYRPDGLWTGYYVDALEPVWWHGDDPTTLRPLVDLFLDLWITPDGDAILLDEDELAKALSQGWLSAAQASSARHTLTELIEGVRTGAFPPAEVGAWPR